MYFTAIQNTQLVTLLRNIGLFLVLFVSAYVIISLASGIDSTFAQNTTQPNPSESGTSPEDITDRLGFTTLQITIYTIFTYIGGVVLYFGGLLLDYTLAYLVVGMGSFLEAYQMNDAIDKLWQVVRDMFNLLFIFSLIFVGFQILLGVNDSQAKRTLVTIIVAALLINFSLYIAKVVVDFSNLAAYEIYNLIAIDPIDGNTDVKGIAGHFTKLTQIQSYATHDGFFTTNDTTQVSTAGVLGYALIVMVFMLLTGAVFIAGAFY